MDLKKIIIILIVCIILVGIVYMFTFTDNSKEVAVNNTTNNTTNTTNITSNITNETTNETLVYSDSESSSYSDYSESSSGNSEPEYGTDGYVDRWDESQRSEDSWAYTHDQPVKTDDDGHSYKRMYDEDTGESYWGKMN